MATKQIPAQTITTCDACAVVCPEGSKIAKVHLEHPKGKRSFELCGDCFDKVADFVRSIVPEETTA